MCVGVATKMEGIRMEGWKDVGIDGADRARIQEEMIDMIEHES